MFCYFVAVICVNFIICFSEIASALTFSLANLSPEYDNYAWNYIVPYRWDKKGRQASLCAHTICCFCFHFFAVVEDRNFSLPIAQTTMTGSVYLTISLTGKATLHSHIYVLGICF